MNGNDVGKSSNLLNRKASVSWESNWDSDNKKACSLISDKFVLNLICKDCLEEICLIIAWIVI